MEEDMRTITDLDGGEYSYDNNSPIAAKNPWSGAIVEITQDHPINLDLWATLMDDEIREHLHAELAPCSDWDFVKAWSELVTIDEVGRVILGS